MRRVATSARKLRVWVLGTLGFALGFAIGLTGAAAEGAAAETAPAPTVLVLSWDGTRHDYPERADTPALDRMQAQGARGTLLPVFPSNTFPNHVAMATGAHTDRHGIVNNVFTDPERGRFSYSNDASWIRAEPLWVAAERQGVRAAAFFWVGSETDWRGRGATFRRAPFDGEISEAAKVEQILAWLDLPAAERPRLIMSWWHGCDSLGHRRGPEDPGIAAQIADQDAHLGRLLAGLDSRGAWSHTSLLVVSDHGMSEVTGALDLPGLLEDAGFEARVEGAGGSAFVHLRDPAQRPALLAHLSDDARLEAYASDALPDGLRAFVPGRSGHVLVLTRPPLAFFRPSLAQTAMLAFKRLLGRRNGMHGYRPDHPDMAAVIYALGRGIPAGSQVHGRAIDVAPSAAALLGIEAPQQSEGRALFGPLAGESP